jgi:Domain of unknown function (DUF2382)
MAHIRIGLIDDRLYEATVCPGSTIVPGPAGVISARMYQEDSKRLQLVCVGGVICVPRGSPLDLCGGNAVHTAARQASRFDEQRHQATPTVQPQTEEQLEVGKRMVETGKTRVRRFVTEREVSADVTLHEEHADVLRWAVTDPQYLLE